MGKFRSELDERVPHEFAENGFKTTMDVYEDVVNSKTGKLETIKTGEEPFYNKIQEAVDGVLLENIIERYKIDLNDRHITQITEDVDMSAIPSDAIETYAIVTKLQAQYDASTAEIKNHFGDFAGFLTAATKGTLAQELESIASEKFKKDAEMKRAYARELKLQQERELAEAQARVEEIKATTKGINYGE